MVLHDRGVDVAHVGDSRAYVIRANQIYPLTRDHSMVQGMIDAGMLTEQQAIGHPDANKITRALGMRLDVEVEVRPEPMELYAGDVLLMASDGLTDLALNADILGCTLQALASGSVEHACRMLVQFANNRGGHDNITVQMACVLEAGSRALTVPDEGGFAGPAALRPQAPPESPQASAPAPTAHPAHLHETITMTRAEGAAPPAGGAPQPMQPAPTAPWGAIPPTSPDATGLGPPAPGLGAMGPYGPTPRAAPSPLGAERGPAFSAGPMAIPGARPARGGIVFMVIGLSAVIAVLLLVLLWALLPR
jgi:protein phosphatase